MADIRYEKIILLIKLHLLSKMNKGNISLEYVNKYQLKNVFYDYLNAVFKQSNILVSPMSLVSATTHLELEINRNGLLEIMNGEVHGVNLQGFKEEMFTITNAVNTIELGSDHIFTIQYETSDYDAAPEEGTYNRSMMGVLSELGADDSHMCSLIKELYGRPGETIFWEMVHNRNLTYGALSKHFYHDIGLGSLLEGSNSDSIGIWKVLQLYFLTDPFTAYLYLLYRHAIHVGASQFEVYAAAEILNRYLETRFFRSYFSDNRCSSILVGRDSANVAIKTHQINILDYILPGFVNV